MNRFGLVLAFCGLAAWSVGTQTTAKADATPASPQTAKTADGWETLTHDELGALLGGATVHRIHVISATGLHYTMELKPDGTLKGESESGGGGVSSTLYDDGNWKIKESQFCFQWNHWQMRRVICWTIAKNLEGKYRSSSASQLTFTQ